MKIFHEAQKKFYSVCPRRFESLFVGLLCLFSSLSFHFGHVAGLGAGTVRENCWNFVRLGWTGAPTVWSYCRSSERHFWVEKIPQIFGKLPRKLHHPNYYPLFILPRNCLHNFISETSIPKTARNLPPHKAPPQGKIRVHFLSLRYYDRSVTTTTNFLYPFFRLAETFPYSPSWMNRHSFNRFIFKLACLLLWIKLNRQTFTRKSFR